MQIKTYTEMDYHELDKLIETTFGHSYEFVAYEELSNDSSKTYNVSQKEVDESHNEWDQKNLDDFIATGNISNWRTHVLLVEMCKRGVLQPGNFLIEVCW